MPTSTTGISRRAGGFTLVELCVVAMMIVTLAAVAVPAFAGFWRATQVRSCAWRIAALARAARDYSISRGLRTALEYDSEGRAFSLAVESDPANAPGEFEALRLASAQPVTAPDAVEAVDFTVEGRSSDQDRPVMFFPDGQALQADIVLAPDQGQSYSVEINMLTGQAKVTEGDVREAQE